jgi:two-component system response regulator QseB
LHVEGRLAVWPGAPVPLTMKEFWLLETLVRQRSRVLTRRQVEDSLSGWGDETGSNTVEVHRLCKKFSNKLIATLRGIGYQLGQVSAIEA